MDWLNRIRQALSAPPALPPSALMPTGPETPDSVTVDERMQRAQYAHRERLAAIKRQGHAPANAPALFSSARSHTSAEGAKNGYILLIAAIAPFVLAAILALGVGYFFAGFQPFTWTVPGILSYGGGFAVEAVCLACYFASAKAFWGGQRWHFLASLVAALLLSTVSISSQILYLQLEGLKGAGTIPPGALDTIPIIGALVGNNGVGWVILARAIGFHVAEAACCFVLAKSTDSPEKRVKAMQAEQRAYLELQRAERIAALERRIFEHAFTLFERAEAGALGGPGPVPALPAPGEKADPLELPIIIANGHQGGQTGGASNGTCSF